MEVYFWFYLTYFEYLKTVQGGKQTNSSLLVWSENTHHGGSISVRPTSCLTGLDLTKQVKLLLMLSVTR